MTYMWESEEYKLQAKNKNKKVDRKKFSSKPKTVNRQVCTGVFSLTLIVWRVR